MSIETTRNSLAEKKLPVNLAMNICFVERYFIRRYGHFDALPE